MTKCIAFHSYKGGTGKTTIASNFAVLLTQRGYRVFLLDLDVYAPSLQAYFDMEPAIWINDFLWNNAKVEEILVDLTPTVLPNSGGTNNGNGSGGSGSSGGKLYVGFCNPKKEEIYRLDGAGKQDSSKIQLLRRFVLLREQIISNYDADYIIIDTSPGIRYWSINALAVADTLFLTLKMDNLDIDGTKKMAGDIYSSFSKFGAKSYLVLNRVVGYCTPPPSPLSGGLAPKLAASSSQHLTEVGDKPASTIAIQQQHENEDDVGDLLSKDVGMDIICSIPCYCDIQFSRREFLTVLKHPDHPFAKRIEKLAEEKQIKIDG
jgi:MinD-like ATPase involved in chromosome partitioning or flagellar assembly